MSEEAVRQTRSQKRALERDAPPQTSEPSSSDNESKKLKLEQSEPTAQEENTPRPDPELQRDGQNLTETGSNEEPRQLPLPLESQPVKDEAVCQGSSNNQTGCNDRARKELKAEKNVDTMSRFQPSEPKVSGGMLAAGEVKATIKVEVQTGEQPVDMSTSKGIKSEKWPPSPEEEEEEDDDDDDDDDVIILSDNDSPSPPMNGLNHLKELDTDLLMKSSPAERERIIRQLKEELRLEEAKLVLLKKLRQSQLQRDTLQKASGVSSSSAPPPLIRGSIGSSKGSQQIVTGRSSGTVIPPPLVRGGQQVSSKHGSQIIMPPLVRGAQQIQALRQQQQQQQLAASGGGGSGPPPLLLGARTSAPAGQGQRNMVQTGLIRIGSTANSLGSSTLKISSSGSGVVSLVGTNDSPASRQAAAKLALRKQLEKTLLEIPPPKPPAPEFNFLPSAANNEFIYLVGLEEVVQNLLDTIHRGKTGVAPSKPTVKDPNMCTQCNTDFTCRWRQDKAKGGTVLCEDCMSSNQKKALKAEHTNRLKAAFVKALQQEQEIEQRIIQQSSSSISHGSSSSSSSLKAEQLVSQQLKHARASSLHRGANVIHHHSIKSTSSQLSHSGVRGVPHSFSSSSQLQSAVAAAALVSRPGVTMAYVNPSLSGHKTSASVDARQREYLLDMIPSRSSISQTANTWK
ncbi:transcriptional repressor p66 alpha-like isoform X2 [Phyllopteryx taeniolatus]|uniref:transcriptional repressor p66 alpha-like isoform X2 n=1 Tax=Phyllopteryx taeniolatus TaxID=161469 RepID=UPI002AD48E97|nr:transcriptional repressor p66 alpha-like isoform X2 [Phyllopteryx taeniolatus]